MLPTPEQVHIDAALSNISIAWAPPQFVGEQVFRSVPVTKQSDKFYKFLKGAWFRDEAKPRGPGARAPRSGYHVTSDTYACIERTMAHPIPIETLNNADVPLRPWETGVRYATNGVLLAKERLIATAVCTSGNWTTSNDCEGHWIHTDLNPTNTFIVDVLDGMEAVRKLIGMNPNVLLIDAGTMKSLKMNVDLIDRIKYGGTPGSPAAVNPQALAALFGLDEVIIAGAIYSTAKESKAGTDFTAANIWEANAGKGSAFLFYRPPAPGIEVPAPGYIFNWRGDAGQMSQLLEGGPYRTVRRWWEDAEKQWVVEAGEYFDVKVTSADAGCLFYDTLAN